MPATRNPELAARRLLKELDVRKAPIDLRFITRKLGIELHKEVFDAELSGVLIKEGPRTVICYNAQHHENRRRFTVAHEIGHFVLGHPGEMIVDKALRDNKAVIVRRDGRSSEGTDNHEIEANRFAAELLMPRDFIEEEARKRLAKTKIPSRESIVAELARLFRVSSQAMQFRLVNLGFLMAE